MAYSVRPSKGDFLLLTVMNIAGYNDNNGCSVLYDMRQKTREHFAREINNPLVLEFYNLWMQNGIHNHPPWNAVLDIQKTEFGLTPSGDKNSERIRSVLEKFRSSTDFDEFYFRILPEYIDVCEEVGSLLRKVDFINILDDAWEFKADFDVCVIPRPLDKVCDGYGPKIGNNALAIIAPGRSNGIPSYNSPFVRDFAAHEVSHTYIQTIEKQVMEIAESKGFAGKLRDFARSQEARDYRGESVLEETMLRALQARYIGPFLDLPSHSIEKELILDHEEGFEHIFKFDEAIRKHKENPEGSLAEAIADLMEKLLQYS